MHRWNKDIPVDGCCSGHSINSAASNPTVIDGYDVGEIQDGIGEKLGHATIQVRLQSIARQSCDLL